MKKKKKEHDEWESKWEEGIIFDSGQTSPPEAQTNGVLGVLSLLMNVLPESYRDLFDEYIVSLFDPKSRELD